MMEMDKNDISGDEGENLDDDFDYGDENQGSDSESEIEDDDDDMGVKDKMNKK